MKAQTLLENQVLERKVLSQDIHFFKVHCPDLAGSCKAGQFVVVRTDEVSERIPLTIADFDGKEGWITLIVQTLGASTLKMAGLKEGDRFADVVGPLGKPSEIEKYGTVVCIGGGVGIAPVFPIARELKKAGNKVVSIIGSRSKDLLFWEEEMRAVSDELLVSTDDGSYGHKGFVTDLLMEVIERDGAPDRVVAIGPVVMMRAVSKVTTPREIPCIVSLNSVMVDGTGMCGGCRVAVGGKAKFVCVDGPEFMADQVDFEELMRRQGIFKREENLALWEHKCRLEDQISKIQKAKKRVEMPRQDPKARARNFEEVALGYTKEMAVAEALRCLHCKKPFCVEGCPVEIDIPAFIGFIQAGDFDGAVKKIKEKNSLPAVCGRVCPQETQCEERCVLARKGEPVAIGRLERFVADWEAEQGKAVPPVIKEKKQKKVAVIGSGPAGLTCAGDLALMGYDVTIFEALHKAGGVLVYGIPEFRLPKAIVQRECDYISDLGVKFKTSKVIGLVHTLDDLRKQGFDAFFIGTGAGLPYFMNIPGEDLNGVYSANEFLTRTNLMKAYLFPKYDTPLRLGNKVAVVGGGNVAMDAARSSLRLGADEVSIVYRRSRVEMPAREEEIENAEEEGVIFRNLCSPVEILGDEKGWVRALRLIRMELGEPDSSGRRRPVPIEGSEFELEMDTVVIAIGQGPNPLLIKRVPGLELNRWGNIVADEETGKTSLEGVFAGGDIVTGAATVILAMGAGKKAARGIDEYLRTGKW